MGPDRYPRYSGIHTRVIEIRPEALDRCLRLSSGYRMVSLDSLSESEKHSLRLLRARNPQFDTVLLPTAPGRSIKVVGEDIADVVRGLGSGSLPGDLPETAELGLRKVTRLVLDGLLEIESDGGWFSGVRAVDTLLEGLPEVRGDSATGRASLEALRYVQCLPIDEPFVLAERLYRYNRLPISPRLARTLGTEEAVAHRLGLDAQLGGRVIPEAVAGKLTTAHNDYWLQWGRRTARARTTAYKLYVCPELRGLRAALNAAFELFTGPGAPVALKTGRVLPALLRPDKLVLYFADKDALDIAAAHLLERLAGAPSIPVPFTTDVDGTGLLSWGVDPPIAWRIPGWRKAEGSWRGWVTTRLGAALFAARSDPTAPVAPWQFAIARVAVDGVDTATWSPDEHYWSARESRS